MPRVLLDRSAGSDCPSSSRRRWYGVPASVAAHGVVILAVAVSPLLAPTARPAGPPSLRAFLIDPAPPVPPPLPAAPRASAPAVVRPDQNAAPVDAPAGVEPETGLERAVPGVTPLSAPAGVVVGPELGLPAGGTVGAPLPPPHADPVRPGGDIEYPKKIVDVVPEYPPAARWARVEGVVIIEATIGPDGAVTGARVLRSVPLLNRAALDAVSRVALPADAAQRRAGAGDHHGDGAFRAARSPVTRAPRVRRGMMKGNRADPGGAPSRRRHRWRTSAGSGSRAGRPGSRGCSCTS